MKKNNGFSLLELIVVIAIMAILVGLMAPFFINYLEKTKVSSDIQLGDTVRKAMEVSITDAKVISDPDSAPFLNQMDTPAGMDLDDSSFISNSSVLKDSLTDILGFNPENTADYLVSKHGASKCNVTTTNGIVVVTFTCTDNTGKGDTSSSSTDNDITVSPNN